MTDRISDFETKVVTGLLEEKIESLAEQQKTLKKQKSELELELSISPRKINAETVLKGLRNFLVIYDDLTPQEKAEYLQYVIQEVTVTESKVDIKLFAHKKAEPIKGSTNHPKWWAVKESNLQPTD